MARGLNFLHLANPHAMIHRDLKPSNIMFAGLGAAMGQVGSYFLLHNCTASLNIVVFAGCFLPSYSR